MRKYGIIVIGYNRINSLKRLLNALNQAVYGDENPMLIISLDYAGMPEIVEFAEQFQWRFGEKIVKAYKEREGLRNHIMRCGDYLAEFELDAVAVFEDDVVPSPAFFNYMTQAVEYYGDNEQIAGISLYTHLWNVNCEKPFQPLYDRHDTFFMQFAQSWGQVWLRKQWMEFKNWYLQNSESFTSRPNVPANVSGWKDSSWLKYHIRYCIETNKYFVYPYESLCTNFTEMGTHHKMSTAIYQVPLQIDAEKQYLFADMENSVAVYDAYFENEKLAKDLEGVPEDFCIDIYGTKPMPNDKKYWLTSAIADYKIIKKYGLTVRPQELNVKWNVTGEEIKLYDMTQQCKNKEKEISVYKKFDYYFRLTHCRWTELIKELKEKAILRWKKG